MKALAKGMAAGLAIAAVLLGTLVVAFAMAGTANADGPADEVVCEDDSTHVDGHGGKNCLWIDTSIGGVFEIPETWR